MGFFGLLNPVPAKKSASDQEKANSLGTGQAKKVAGTIIGKKNALKDVMDDPAMDSFKPKKKP